MTCIYTCVDCGFVFQRVGEVSECPRCEHTHIRFATDEEYERLMLTLHETAPGGCQKGVSR